MTALDRVVRYAGTFAAVAIAFLLTVRGLALVAGVAWVESVALLAIMGSVGFGLVGMLALMARDDLTGGPSK